MEGDHVRRILPWYLLSQFSNIVLSVDIAGTKAYMKRNVEIYTSLGRKNIYIPGASTLLYVPYLKASFNHQGRTATITDLDAMVKGYTFDGEDVVIKSLANVVKGREIKVRGNFSGFHATQVTRWLIRVESAKVFAGKNLKTAEKKGWAFRKIGVATPRNVIFEEAGHYANLMVKTAMFTITTPWGYSYTSPGVVPGILEAIRSYPNEVWEDKFDKVEEVVKDIKSLGEKFTDVALLDTASRGMFSFVVGEIDPTFVKSTLEAKGKKNWDYIMLGSTRAHKNIWFSLLGTKTGVIIARVTLMPFVPPANVILNYPPFHIAPLAGVLYSGVKQVKTLEKKVKKQLDEAKVDYSLYLDDLSVLTQANIRAYDLATLIKEGYPKIETLYGLMNKLSKLEDVADIVGLAYGETHRIDKLLVAELDKPEQTQVKTTAKQQVQKIVL